MFKEFKAAMVLACVVLAGCASNVSRQTPDVKTRRVSSAEVIWVDVGAVPMHVSRSSYGTYTTPAPVIGSADVQRSAQEVNALLTEIRQQMIEQVETALNSSGATRGNDAQILIRVTATHHTITGPGAVLVVSVHFKESPTGAKPWSVEIKGGTPIGSNNKSVADKFARTAVEELATAGIVKPTSQ